MKIHFHPEYWEETAQVLRDAGHEMVEDIGVADVLLFNSFPKDFPQSLPDNIKLIQYAFAGVDHLRKAGILAECTKRGVRWANAGGLYADSVAESALALMLSAAHMHPHVSKRATWMYNEADEQTKWLHGGKKVLLIGAGRIGEQLIRFLAPFAPEITAVNKSGRDVAGAHITLSFEEFAADTKLVADADFVVVIAPLTDQTQDMIGADFFSNMKESAIFVNVGRGGIVQTNALADALESHEIFAAGIDVVSPEPLPDDHRLWGLDNVVITPHVATTMERTRTLLGPLAVDNLAAYEAGQPLPTEVDATAGY